MQCIAEGNDEKDGGTFPGAFYRQVEPCRLVSNPALPIVVVLINLLRENRWLKRYGFGIKISS